MIKKFSYIVLTIIALTTITLGYYASKLKFDYNLDNFFPKSDKENAYFKQFRKDFSGDDDFLVIGIEAKNSIFNQEFLHNLDSLTNDLENTNLITQVISPTNVVNPVVGPFGLMNNKYIHINDSSLWKDDSTEIYNTSFLVNNIFSSDKKSICIYLTTAPNVFKPHSDTLLNQISHSLKKYNFENAHIAGKIQSQKVYIEKMQQEMVLFTSVAVLLLIVLLYIAFRTWWGIVIPFTVVACSIVCTLGFYAIMGQHIDIMTVILPSIMFVVGLSDVVHFTTKYLEELRLGKSNEEAIIITVKEVGFATFLTAFTTALGFATLATANVIPIQNFGIYTAIGVLLAYCLSFTLLPAILIHLKKPKITETKQIFWDVQLHRLLATIFKNKIKIIASFSVVLIISLVFITQIKTNTKILDDVAEDDPLMQDFRFFEQKFGGVRGFELSLKLTDSSKSFLDLEVLKSLEATENYLSSVYKVNNINSPVSMVKLINKALNGGLNSGYKLPETKAELAKIKQLIYKYRKKNIFKNIINFEKNIARMTGKTVDEGSYIMNKKNERFNEYLARESNRYIEYHITGTAHLINLNNDYITNDMMQGLLLDLFVVGTIVAFMFRSMKMSFIALIPNLVPLLVVAAIMGIAGIELKISTSIVFSIAFGIAVDDTIHFISKLKFELSQGSSVFYAVKRTYLSTGKAIIITSLLLVGGFSTLLLSNFQGTFYLGFLVSLTLFVAVFADLLLLPVLVVMFYKKKK